MYARLDNNAQLAASLRTAIAQLSRQLRHTSAAAGLTPSQISVLFTIVRAGPLRMTELAIAEGINPTMLSRITGNLCRRGLIEREPDPEDRRAIRVRATAAAEQMRESIQAERSAALAQYTETLDEQQRRTLRDAIPILEHLAQRARRDAGWRV